jgi:DNA-binding transcriptional MerR regulator
MSPDALIPKRALFKPAEVCSIAGVKPYILRSWEAEFQTLGRGSKTAGARVYRRADVEMVLRIKDLVFSEGLTLGAARRKIEGEAKPGPSGAEQELLGDLFGADPRERLGQVKEGLRSILELLSESGEAASKSSDSVGDRVDAVPVSQARKTKKAARPVASTKKAASRKPKKKSA